MNKRNKMRTIEITLRQISPRVLATLFTMMCLVSFAKDNNAKIYQQVDLVSDQPGTQLQDTNLVNAWGMAFNATGPFWVSANGTGLSTLYSVTNDSTGAPHVAKLGLEVSIPGEGNPTGQVFNDTTNFNGDAFIFASEDGVISGWRSALGTSAEVLAVNTNAVYKGIALAKTVDGPILLAANFSQGTVDIYDGAMNLISQLSDTNAPDNYAPFNVQPVGGRIFVTFAKQDTNKVDDVPGRGHGLIDVLNLDNGNFHRFITGSDAGGHFKALNSPWGIALAPDNFGHHGGNLLIGNFGSGAITVVDKRGHFKGFLESRPGRLVIIEGLWAIGFGNGGKAGVPGTLYFTAGPDDESHGLFGSLAPVPKPQKPGKPDKHDKDHHP